MPRCRKCGEGSLVAASPRGLCEDCDPAIFGNEDEVDGR